MDSVWLPADEHPLSEAGCLLGEHVWIVGNRHLLSLNVSNNLIHEPGFCSLLSMVKVCVIVVFVIIFIVNINTIIMVVVIDVTVVAIIVVVNVIVIIFE